MYRVLVGFCDLIDANHVYVEGDTYPREGMEPTKERIEELLTDKNRRRQPLIEKVEEVKAEKPKTEDKEEPAEEPKKAPAKKAPAKKAVKK